MRNRLAIRAAIVLLAAFANAAGLAWPFDVLFPTGEPQWSLQLVGLALFCWVLNSCTSQRCAFLTSVLFSTAWLCGVFWWLFVALHTYGGLSPVLATAAIVLLAAALALYYGLSAAVYWRLKSSNPIRAASLFGLLWMAAELARGTWLTGFGWGAIAYAHGDGPLRALIPWVGVYGVCAIAAALAMLATHIRKLSWATVNAVPIALLALAVAPHLSYTESTGKLSVTLLQGNIPQDQKFEPGTGVPAALNWYAAQHRAATTDLVVSPETAIPLLPQDLPPGYWAALQAKFQTGPSALLTGIPLGDSIAGYTNSVVGLGGASPQVWRYDKHHLVPFGEFTPPLFRWFTAMMNIPLGDFNRGALGQPSFEWKGQRLAPNICYEDLFGEELGVRFIDPEAAPTLFVNVSNIGWFGDTVAIDQHLQISRMRALEFERPFVRATNTGATVIIDHRAQVTAALPRLTQGALVGDVEGRSGLTPYAWWVSRLGLWPYWTLIAIAVALAWRARVRNAQ